MMPAHFNRFCMTTAILVGAKMIGLAFGVLLLAQTAARTALLATSCSLRHPKAAQGTRGISGEWKGPHIVFAGHRQVLIEVDHIGRLHLTRCRPLALPVPFPAHFPVHFPIPADAEIVVFPQECRIAVGGRVFVQFLGLLGGHMCLLNIPLVVIRIAAVGRMGSI